MTKTEDETIQKTFAKRTSEILEEVIDIDDDLLDDESAEVIETQTKFEFNLGFAKISRSVKRVKKETN